MRFFLLSSMHIAQYFFSRQPQYDAIYGINSGVDSARFNTYGFEANGRPAGNPSNVPPLNNPAVPAGLYSAQQGSRYALGLPTRTNSGSDSKMNGLHGPKHKRGDMDRECK